VLTSDVKPELREAWYERQAQQGVQVAIAHPKLVCLGLDLLDYTDLIFWETGYSLYTLRQASRRSWRIGQTEEVTVKYFAYAKTAQDTCLRLMGRKLLVALAIEGKFSTEGLQTVAEDDDLLMAMARELVTEKGIGETADQVWRSVQMQYTETFGRRESQVSESNTEPLTEQSPETPILVPQSSAVVQQLLMFGTPIYKARRRKPSRRLDDSDVTSAQLPLF